MNKMKQAYNMKFHGPLCYSCGIQEHVRRDFFKFFQGASHGGRRRNIWSMIFDHHEDGAM